MSAQVYKYNIKDLPTITIRLKVNYFHSLWAGLFLLILSYIKPPYYIFSLTQLRKLTQFTASINSICRFLISNYSSSILKHGNITSYHNNIISYSHSVISYRDNLKLYQGDLISHRDNLILYHDNLISYHGNLISYCDNMR